MAERKVISTIHGGLGNQMFQYSVGRCLADKTESEFILDTHAFAGYHRPYLLDKFRIRAVAGEIFKEIPVFKEKVSFEYDKTLMSITTSVRLEGYWQNSKYFDHARKQILEDFTPVRAQKSEFLEQVDSNESVSVHYRRKDYLSIDDVQGICTDNYYADAKACIIERTRKPLFVLFSDDIEWLKNIRNKNSIICSITDPLETLVIMSRCRHNIICNSSFSWWGAWLNRNLDKIVVAPKKWHNRYQVNSDILLDTWVKV